MTRALAVSVAGLIFFAVLSVVVRASVHIPDKVVIEHKHSGYTTLRVEIDGLEDLQPEVRARIQVQLPEGFTINAPTDFKGTVDGEVRVKEER